MAELIAELSATGTAEEWEFKPDDFHIDRGDRIKAVNTGGEFHTFTEVAAFGGGCIPALNGGAAPIPECADFPALAQTTGSKPVRACASQDWAAAPTCSSA